MGPMRNSLPAERETVCSRCGPAFLMLMFLFSSSLACSPEDVMVTETAVRDSLGISIVESAAPLWDQQTSWTLDPTPVVEIDGRAEESRILFGTRRVRVLKTGRIVVASSQLDEVTFWDGDGDRPQGIGGRGEGPGEFSRVNDVYRCAADTLVVNDFTRISVFDSAGHFHRTVGVSPSNRRAFFRIEGVFPDCGSLLVQSSTYEMPRHGTVGGVEAGLFSLDLSRQTLVDPIIEFPAFWIFHKMIAGGSVPIRLPWAPEPKWAVANGQVYFGPADQPEIRVLSPDGTMRRIIRWDQPREPVGVREQSLYEALRERWLPEIPPLRDVLPPLGEYPNLPEERPFYLSLLVDDEGYIWVREYPEYIAGRPDLFGYGGPVWKGGPDGQVDRWRVFDTGGRWLGIVSTPAEFSVLSIEGGYVAGVFTDELDVEHVKLYRINKDSDSSNLGAELN